MKGIDAIIMILKPYSIILLCCSFLISCHAPLHSSKVIQLKKKKTATENLHINKEVSEANKIVFLTFAITETDSTTGDCEIKWVNTSYKDGTLKKTILETIENPQPSNIYYQLLENNSPSNNLYNEIPNPLMMVYEYPADANGFGKTTVKNKSGTLIIRFQLTPNLAHFYFYKSTLGSNTLKKIYHAVL